MSPSNLDSRKNWNGVVEIIDSDDIQPEGVEELTENGQSGFLQPGHFRKADVS
jgi:hypothetical protein